MTDFLDKLITENFNKISDQIRILWIKRFEKLFVPLGVEFEDFRGQALYELCANLHSYNPEKGTQFLTFCSVIINNKMKTYATKLNRDKRVINTLTISLNQTTSDDNDSELIEQIADPKASVEIEVEEEADKMVDAILNALPKRKSQIVSFTMCGYTAAEIAEEMKLPETYVKDVLAHLADDCKLLMLIEQYRK